MSQQRVLLADPDPRAAAAARAALEGAGYAVTAVATGPEALDAAARGPFAFYVLDTRALGSGEVSLLHFLRARAPGARVILTADPAEAAVALRAAQLGAALPLLKPVRADDLPLILGKLAAAPPSPPDSLPGEDDDEPFAFQGVVGKSPAMRRVLRLVAKVAPTDSVVIITGETGTGKELIGRVLQRLSPRAEKPYVTVNCGAIPDNLVESELFGHKKGSFTDAIADKKGLFEIANGGTLLLDEVAELPAAAQVKLLRALEDMEIRRVGDPQPVKVDVRVFAATNRDLHEEVRRGAFREDLWYRLNVIQIHLPPLRERREDLPVLLRFFLNEANRKFRKSVVAFAPDALAVIGAYAFPGNVRELRNVIEHAVVMAERDTLRREDLPVHVVAQATGQRLLGPTGAAPAALPGEAFRTIAEAERDLIQATIERLDGNQTEAARRLGISRSTLWRKLKEYHLTVRE